MDYIFFNIFKINFQFDKFSTDYVLKRVNAHFFLFSFLCVCLRPCVRAYVRACPCACVSACVCVYMLYGPFCRGATTFFLWTFLQFILKYSFSSEQSNVIIFAPKQTRLTCLLTFICFLPFRGSNGRLWMLALFRLFGVCPTTML